MSKKLIRNLKTGRFSIDRAIMDKISAVEGLKRSDASRRMFAEFDRKGLTAEQRRRVLISVHAKKA